MEQLKYFIEDNTIAYLLGTNNFTNDESAILELVKNAYDAGALTVTLSFSNDSLTVEDDGIGMNKNDIYNKWMHVGKSEKKYEVIDKNNQMRILAGSKGVGRFALARLGENIKLYSKTKEDIGIIWETDWNKSVLNQDENISGVGTIIVITRLREKWKKKKVQNLINFLSKTYNDTTMKITVIHPEITCDVKPYFPEPCVGKNCLSSIRLEYNGEEKQLYTYVESDEFLNDAKSYCSKLDINRFSIKSNLIDEINSFEYDLSEEELELYLSRLGSFSAMFYFYIKPTVIDKEKFLYKHSGLPDVLPSGVILYRNSFSISAYEGKNDWLGFGKRSRKSPAAATHPTGAWRVRENQISGKVEIDKNRNKFLVDLSNRQGLEENLYFHLFVKIIHIGISEFERYRQEIIRAINVKNIPEIKEDLISDKFVKNFKNFYNMKEEEVIKLVTEIKNFRKDLSDTKKEKETTEERYKYDVRILNVLATVGLKASSIAHEMRNDRNSISTNILRIIEALKEYDMWEILNSQEYTNHVYNNIPYLLKINETINKKIVVFMDVMLSDVEKKQFEPTSQNINYLLNKIKNNWELDYAWVKINVNVNNDLFYIISEDILQVIIDNLILNSIQHNEHLNHLQIDIDVRQSDNLLLFTYKDNGKGLDKKYRNIPRRILEVHETTRKNGHGLGMWIVNNTVIMSGGSIVKINGNPGFSIEFTIGGNI